MGNYNIYLLERSTANNVTSTDPIEVAVEEPEPVAEQVWTLRKEDKTGNGFGVIVHIIMVLMAII